jgi:hypothetical protein
MGRIAYVGAWRDHNKIYVDDSNGGVTIILPDNLTERSISPEEVKYLKEILSKREKK